jgi:hypothetical protein
MSFLTTRALCKYFAPQTKARRTGNVLNKDHMFYGQKTRVSPKDVAKDAVEKMFQGKLSSIYSVKNNVMAFASGLSPSRKLNARISKKLVSK